jgi:hypothetical protein
MPKSAVTLQVFVDNAQSYGDIKPVLTVGGFSLEPACSAMNDAMNGFLADYPYKFNQFNLPFFYTNSWQQDYVLVNPDGSSVTNLAWLQQGIAVQINSTALGKPWTWVQVGRSQIQSTANLGSGLATNCMAPIYSATFLPNNLLYFGTWGDANTGNQTLGNNPVAGSVYTAPLGAISQPANPITQIQDVNGNYLVLTGYGTEGTTAPVAPANSLPGTVATPGSGATTVWKVIDPYGQGIRITPIPGQVGAVWQFRLVGQMQPPRFDSSLPADKVMNQTIFPVTDEYEPHLRALFIAQLYGYSSEAKIRSMFQTKWDLAMKSLTKARQKSDRERDFYKFVPATSVRSGGGGRTGVGPFWRNPR